IVECAGNGESLKSPEVADVSQSFEVAKVPRDADLRPRLACRENPPPLVIDDHKLAPICLVNLAVNQGHLADHQYQMLPHSPRYFAALAVRLFRKGDPQVFLDDATTNFQNVRCQPG